MEAGVGSALERMSHRGHRDHRAAREDAERRLESVSGADFEPRMDTDRHGWERMAAERNLCPAQILSHGWTRIGTDGGGWRRMAAERNLCGAQILSHGWTRIGTDGDGWGQRRNLFGAQILSDAWAQTDTHGRRWTQMDEDGRRWTQMRDLRLAQILRSGGGLRVRASVSAGG